MIDKINNNPVNEIYDKQMASKSDAKKALGLENPDAVEQFNYAELINQAHQNLDIDDKKVQQAKKLLSSDQLDTAANIRKAAENMIDFGI